MRISIFGLGYVGTVCAACMAGPRHSVIGVDTNADKVEAINQGTTLLVESGVDEHVRAAVMHNHLRATTHAGEAVMQSEVSLICVGTGGRQTGALDLDQVRHVSQQIGLALKSKREPHLVVVRSTVLPGTTQGLIAPTLTQHSGRKIGGNLGLCVIPEFLREGSSLDDFYNPPKVVIGESDSTWGDLALSLFEGIETPIIRTSLPIAEMVKYADNAFHALKISFANEIGRICREIGIDGQKVMSILCSDTKLNLSPAYLKPGFAFGGSCLPKDLRALSYHARHLDLETPVLNAVVESNAIHLRWLIEKVESLRVRKLVFLGLSFKPGTDDLRESPFVEAIESLLGKGYSIAIYDPDISTSRLIGANRDFIETRVPHLSSLLSENLEEAVADAELVVVGHPSTDYREAVINLRPDQYVIDLIGVAKPIDTQAKYEGICW